MIKRVLLCIISFFILLSFSSCTEDNQSSNSITQKNTITLICPENGQINGRQIDVFWGEVYQLPKLTKEHYVFNGWRSGDNLLDCVDVWSFSEDLTLIPDWSPQSYPINYIMFPHYSEVVHSYNVETEDFYLMTPPIVPNQMFLGWTDQTTTEPTKCLIIPEGSFGGRVYTGHWISVDEIQEKQDDLVFEIVDDHAVVVGYCGTGEDQVTIPKEYKGYPVTTIGNAAFYGLGRFTNMLNIPPTVTVIEDNAIGACKGLPINILDVDPQEWHRNATIGKNNGGLTK